MSSSSRGEQHVIGAQRPRIELVPRAAYTDAGDDAIALADAAGLHLHDWQQYVMRGMLGETYTGQWSAPRVGLVVPRQQGKGSILEARELAGLFLFGEKLIIHTSQLLTTSREAFYRLKLLIDATPELADQVRQMYEGNVSNSIVLKDGRSIRFMARSKDSGRGLSADLLVIDEAYDVTAFEMAALRPTLSASSNPQTIFTSSAALPESYVLHDIRAQGMDPHTKRMAYFEWSAPDDCDPDDLDALVASNPSLGLRLTLETVADERADMDDETFKRERLGVLPTMEAARLVTPPMWGACRDEESEVGEDLFVGVDVGPMRDVAAIALVSPRGDDRVHVEVVDVIDLPMAAARIKEIRDRWHPRSITVDAGGAAGSLAQECRALGVSTKPIAYRDIGQSAGAMFDAIKTRSIAHIGQPELDNAVAAADRKYMGATGLWRWVPRKDSAESVSVLVAASYALLSMRKRTVRRNSALRKDEAGAPRRTGWRVGSR